MSRITVRMKPEWDATGSPSLSGAATVDRPAQRLLTLVAVLYLYYLSYRYPLQVNSSLTSPSYSDTPGWLQSAKYAVFILLLAMIVLYFAVSRTKVRFEDRAAPPVVVLGTLAVALWPICQSIVLRRVELFPVGIFFLLPVVFLLVGPRLSATSVFNVLRCFAVVALIVEVVQVGLFFAVGRLPALAYAGTSSIRFGSLWDDPNGFAMVVAWLIPVVAVGFRRFGWIMISALLVMLVLTQSITGVFAVLGGVALTLALFIRFKAAWISALAVVVLVFVAIWAWSLRQNAFVASFLDGKALSVQGHLASGDVLAQFGPDQLLGLSPSPVSVESGWVDLIGSGGAVYAVAYAFLLLVILFRALANAARTDTPRTVRGLHLGTGSFAAAVLLGLTNLPLHSVFPVDALVGFALVVEYCTMVRPQFDSKEAHA